jgi:hypothetical protein
MWLRSGYLSCTSRNRLNTTLSICLSDPQGRDEAVAQGAQNSVKKGGPFWDPSIEGERAREPRGAHPSLTLAHPGSPLTHPAREVRVFKAAWCR